MNERTGNERTGNGGAAGESPRPRGTVLLVDDEAYVRDSLSRLLARRGFTVRCAASVAEALQPENLAGVDAVLVDLKLAGEDGLTLVRRVAVHHIKGDTGVFCQSIDKPSFTAFSFGGTWFQIHYDVDDPPPGVFGKPLGRE